MKLLSIINRLLRRKPPPETPRDEWSVERLAYYVQQRRRELGIQYEPAENTKRTTRPPATPGS
jgi:hypothetical protein